MGSVHLDRMKVSTIKTFADGISHMRDPSQQAMIRFASPQQFLVVTHGKPILDAVLNKEISALPMVVMDEVHIASQFGNTFRGKFKLLKSKFYAKLPACCNINIFMKGTCMESILYHVERLFRFEVPNRYWLTHEDTRYHSVSITLKYTPLILNEIKMTLSMLLKSGTPSAPKKAIIYSNMRQKIITLAKKVGRSS